MDSFPKTEINLDADTDIGATIANDLTTTTFSQKLVNLSRPDSVQGESIAAVRNYLVNQHVREGRRAIALCSPTSGSGCTYISANLAVALAQAGLNTLLVDGNMRNPGIDDLISTTPPRPGLMQYLQGDESSVPLVLGQVIPNLSVLYAGGVAANAQELLSSSRLKRLLDDSVRSFDMTIVDCPAAASYSDARRIASVVRHAAIVVRRDHSLAHDLKSLIAEFHADRVSIVGSVLNVF